MSGPKTSRYRLTEAQRRILAEQRAIEQRKAAATESIKRTQKKMLQIKGSFSTEKQIAAELIARTGNDNGLGDILTELDAVIAFVDPLIAKTDYNTLASVEQTATELSAHLATAECIAGKAAAVSAQNKDILKANLQETIAQGFITTYEDTKKVNDGAFQPEHTEVAKKLEELQEYDFLPQAYKAEIEDVSIKLKSITNEVFFKNFVAVTVNPLLKKVDLFTAEYMDCKEEFGKLYAEYVALCNLYYYVPQEYACSRASIQILRSEIQRIKDAAAEDDEQVYISECLDEIMREMGYSILGSREVVKRNGTHFRNELYAFEEGTAVNITYSSDGRIAMEIGGIDTCDRLPNKRETDRLCASMEQFCDDFKEIEKRLFAKGITLADRISLLPPDAEYAQIINVTEFSMKANSKNYNAKKRNRAKDKPKAMHRE